MNIWAVLNLKNQDECFDMRLNVTASSVFILAELGCTAKAAYVIGLSMAYAKMGQILNLIMIMLLSLAYSSFFLQDDIIFVQVLVKLPHVQNMRTIIRGKASNQRWFVLIHLGLVLLIS
jgi:hypothetical protein